MILTSRSETVETTAAHILLVGGVIVVAIPLKAALERIGLPDLLGYLGLGLALGLVNDIWNVLPAESLRLLTFLADLGMIALLFRIGLECNPEVLLNRLSGAVPLWLVNFTASAGAGLAAVYVLLDWSLLASLFVALALTATSIGVPVRVWQRFGRLDSREGTLLIDTAQLDDLSGVVLLVVLAALTPRLQTGLSPELLVPLAGELAWVLTKVAVLFAVGALFAQHLEQPLTRRLRALQPRPDTMLVVLGIGLCVTGLTALLGIPVAIGGFFAGLLFSSDPLSVKINASFDSLYDLFVPFFFVHVGTRIELETIGLVQSAGLVLLAAVAGKLIGGFLPARQRMAESTALLFAISLVPRSELTLVIIERGRALGVVPQEVFATLVLVVIATMIGVPLVLNLLLRGDGAPPPTDDTGKEASAEDGSPADRSKRMHAGKSDLPDPRSSRS